MLPLICPYVTPPAVYATSVIYVDDDKKDYPAAEYTSIQAAVNKAASGSTIIVYPGIYSEALTITKPLKIEGVGYPLITPLGVTVIDVKASGVSLEGLYVAGSVGKGRYLIRASSIKNLTIVNCRIEGSSMGTIGYDSNFGGIYIHNSTSIKIDGNYITISCISNDDIRGGGIHVSSSSAVEITKNQIDGYSITDYYRYKDGAYFGAIYIGGSSGVRITYNQISRTGLFDFYVAYGGGIFITGGSGIEIIGNEISNNSISAQSPRGGGIYIADSSAIKISGNVISGNTQGVYLSNVAGVEIFFNDFKNNTRGHVGEENTAGVVFHSLSKLNYVYGNRNYTSYLGNYWDKYEGGDKDGNGIGDTPYGEDAYPLIKPIENYKTEVKVYTTPVKEETTVTTTLTTTETVTRTVTQPITTTVTQTATATREVTKTITITATGTVTATITTTTTLAPGAPYTTTVTTTATTTVTKTVTQPETVTTTTAYTVTKTETIPPQTTTLTTREVRTETVTAAATTVTTTRTILENTWLEPPVALISAVGMLFISLVAAFLIARKS